jgi:hypothetical protein
MVKHGCTTTTTLSAMLQNTTLLPTSTKTKSGSSSSSLFSWQPLIIFSVQNMTDFWKANDSNVEFAIANFFHCNNVADQVAESP